MSKKHLLPPWRDIEPDGTLGEEYGPRTLATFRRHIVRHRDWSYRPERKEREGGPADAALLHGYMTLEDGSIREDVSPRQRDSYMRVYVDGVAIKALAREWGINRSSVKAYLRRLKVRARR